MPPICGGFLPSQPLRAPPLRTGPLVCRFNGVFCGFTWLSRKKELMQGVWGRLWDGPGGACVRQGLSSSWRQPSACGAGPAPGPPRRHGPTGGAHSSLQSCCVGAWVPPRFSGPSALPSGGFGCVRDLRRCPSGSFGSAASSRHLEDHGGFWPTRSDFLGVWAGPLQRAVISSDVTPAGPCPCLAVQCLPDAVGAWRWRDTRSGSACPRDGSRAPRAPCFL